MRHGSGPSNKKRIFIGPVGGLIFFGLMLLLDSEDNSSYLNIILINIIIILFFYVIIKINKNHKNKESRTIESEIDFKKQVFSVFKEKYPKVLILSNVILPMKDSIREFELDLMIFSAKGIFVLEIKDWDGTIINEDDTWTLKKYNESVESPLIELNANIEKINKLYRYDYKGYVILNNKCKLKSKMDNVLSLDEFINLYSDLFDKYFESEVKKCYNFIKKEIENNY